MLAQRRYRSMKICQPWLQLGVVCALMLTVWSSVEGPRWAFYCLGSGAWHQDPCCDGPANASYTTTTLEGEPCCAAKVKNGATKWQRIERVATAVIEMQSVVLVYGAVSPVSVHDSQVSKVVLSRMTHPPPLRTVALYQAFQSYLI